MKKSKNPRNGLRIAREEKTSSEIYSIILKGIISAMESIFKDYYVSENIEALMSYINSRQIIKSQEYKRLLSEAKDFYPVIICAVFINPMRKHTKDFTLKELSSDKKAALFEELNKELFDFFADWLCVIDFEPLLLHRLAAAYRKQFNLQLCISKILRQKLTELEEQVLKLQIIEVFSIYLIEQVAVHLGVAGLDYLDYYTGNQDQGLGVDKLNLSDHII